jgi:uncharacterized membrane protein required for colicin V production
MTEPFLLPEGTALIINLSIIGLAVILALIGYFRGFVSQFYDVVFLFIGFLVASLLAGPLASQVPILPPSVDFTNIPFIGSVLKLWFDTLIWMIILTVLLWSLSLLGKRFIIRKVLRYEKKTLIDHIAGAVVAVWPVLLLGVVTALLLSIPLIGNGRTVLAETVFSPFAPLGQGVMDQFVEDNPVISLVDKLQSGEELTDEDFVTIEATLVDMGFPQEVTDVAMKVIKGSEDDLTEADIQVLKDYAEANNVTKETVSGWLTEFGFTQEQIDELLGDYAQP